MQMGLTDQKLQNLSSSSSRSSRSSSRNLGLVKLLATGLQRCLLRGWLLPGYRSERAGDVASALSCG
jgi:hypothetical protein